VQKWQRVPCVAIFFDTFNRKKITGA